MRRISALILIVSCSLAAWSCNLSDPNPPTQSSDVEDSGADMAASDTSGDDASDTEADGDGDDVTSDAAEDTTEDTADGGDECEAPEERCGNECVNTQTDPQNCGQCNAPCAPPPNTDVASCTAGDCVFECQDGFYDINGDLLGDGCESACAPDATEVCGDDVDNDCDGAADEGCDCDPGQTRPCGSDTGACEAGEQSCGSDATWGDCEGQTTARREICNGIDDDCDGQTDEDAGSTFYRDQDGDGYGDPGTTTRACSAPGGYVDNANDCDDGDASVNPGEDEVCNGADDDCDGQVDENAGRTYYYDGDGDGYGDSSNSQQACSPSGDYDTTQGGDCDDSDPDINPGEDEVCNGIDDNCADGIDEGVSTTYYNDSDRDGYGDSGNSQQACSPMGDYDTTQGGDCHDGDPNVHPGAEDFCNGVDDDCDNTIDEDGLVYHDGDGDGYGDPNDTASGCNASGAYVRNDLDCNDADEEINPDAQEYCFDSGVDRDCDGEPACGDSDCDELYCQTPRGGEGYCINNSCTPGGNCTVDSDCNSGLVCYQNCCCPDYSPCICNI